jgi:hypothetical protein
VDFWGEKKKDESDFNDRNGEQNEISKAKQRLYFLSHVCSKSMKLTPKSTFSVQTHFLLQDYLALGIICRSGKYGSTL